MNVTEYLRIIRQHWVPVTAIALAGIVLASLFAFTRTPMYTTSSQVFVSFHGAESTSELATGTTYVQRRVVSYANLVRSPQVLDPVIEELGLDTTPGELGSRVQASPVTDTVLVDITATDADPTEAARIANTVAESLAERVDELETPQRTGDSPVQLQLVREAVTPGSASYPNIPVLVLVGFLLATALGIALAVLREIADTRVRSEQDLRAVTDSAVIGTITMDDEAKQNPLVVQTSPYHTRSEAFRRLRTNLQFLDLDGGPQALVVTSSVPNEGKTTSAINLAITLADADAKVLLIDADLRRPSVAGYLGIEGSVGLTTLLIQRATVDDVVQPWGSAGLFVIPSGAVPPNPAELVGSKTMARLIEELSEQFDYVIIDTPPLQPVTDAALIARMTSGVLMVVGAGQIRREQLRQSLANLSAVSARVLGIVLNKVGRGEDAYGASYGYEYQPRTDDTDGKPGKKIRGPLRRKPARPTPVQEPTAVPRSTDPAPARRSTEPVSIAHPLQPVQPARPGPTAEPVERIPLGAPTTDRGPANGLPARHGAEPRPPRVAPVWAPVQAMGPRSGLAPTSQLQTIRVSDRTTTSRNGLGHR
ncbi:polysaccharide biosynthesis tyrosine autokinase [Promicromonospora iranensis]|uniref:non-specific protein-tyrosine kinase n=1 Tax=Promicromonospora iranensis TaxID=1105144 RepID=A0ABU2CR44_9MICO|nr:polysaccharide biosynthesis tyrosine autokinase [Promicromonospora iranensis]MDR7383816.1 capsular exopolysaccharide synthesis family protein [Promicromonospora iranensis]